MRDLSRFERWTCENALRAEESGPFLARSMQLFEVALAGVILAVSLSTGTDPRWVGLSAAVAGVFIGRALPDLLWPRQQRLVAVLYRAWLEREGAEPQA